jgi:putative ABC transport system permease protein
MKHYTSLIRKNGLTQRRRTVLTIFGIILSVCLMSFSVIFIENLKETIFNSAKYSIGYYHMAVSQPSKKQETDLKLHKQVKFAGKVTTRKVKASEFDSSIQLMSLDKDAEKIFNNIKLVAGQLPKKEHEIVLEEWIVEKAQLKMGESLKIGTTFFNLVGVCKNQFNSISNKSSIGYLTENNSLLLENSTTEFLYVQFHEGYVKSQGEFLLAVKNLREAASLSENDIQINTIVYKSLGEYTKRDYPSILIIIVNLLVMGLFIFNTFQISIMERIQQYGILRAIGATPKQIHILVMYEAIIYSIVAIPIGIGISMVLQGLLKYITIFQNSSRITIPYQELLGIAVMAFITIIISVYRPAKAASKVSPIQAIKMTSHLQPVTGENKTSKPFFRSMGISADIAWRNIVRNKSRFIGATLSMSVAIILVILNYGFFSSQDPAALVKNNYLWNSNYYVTNDAGFTDKDRRDLEQLFPKVKIIPTQYENVEINKGNRVENVRFYGYQSSELKEAKYYKLSGKVNLQKLQSGKEIILDIPNKNQSHFKVGDSVTLKFANGNPHIVTVGAIVVSYPTIGDDDEVKIIAHTDFFGTIIERHRIYNRLDLMIEENSESHTEIFSKLDRFVVDGKVRSLYENMESIEEDFKVFQLLMLGFICIISLIGLFSIYNTLVTSYLLRTNEFGILRAIGMTLSQLRTMVIWEGLYYGIFSTVWGISLGLLLHYLQYKIVNIFINGFYKSWEFPLTISISAGFMLVVICILTSIFSSQKLKNTSIMDSIRITN